MFKKRENFDEEYVIAEKEYLIPLTLDDIDSCILGLDERIKKLNEFSASIDKKSPNQKLFSEYLEEAYTARSKLNKIRKEIVLKNL